MKYKVPDQQRLAELAAGDGGLADEIGLCRYLAQATLDNPRLCAEILATVGRLSVAHRQNEKDAGNLLPIETLRAFAARLVAIISEELRDLPDWEQRAERLMLRFRDAMNETQRLTHDDE